MFNLKVNDKPRIRVTTAARKRWPFNLGSTWGQYQRVHVQDGVIHSYSGFTIPPFETISTATGDTTANRPVLLRDAFSHTTLVYHAEPSGSPTVVYYAVSWDDGETWRAFTTLFSGGRYPMVAADPTTGEVIFAALVGTNVYGRTRSPGDELPGQEFAFRDNNENLIPFADDTFGLTYVYDQQSRLVGAFHISGESQISEWWSGDDGRTWRRV